VENFVRNLLEINWGEDVTTRNQGKSLSPRAEDILVKVVSENGGTMRRNERERLARRDAYRVSRPQPSREEKLEASIDGVSVDCTAAELADYSAEKHSAYHEAGHVVAAWCLRQPINRMSFNVEEIMAEDTTTAPSQAFASTGLPLPDMLAMTEGERYVHAVEHAFITLAGVFGSADRCDAKSSNPLCKHETESHLIAAASKFKVISTGLNEPHQLSQSDIDTVDRLIPIVDEFLNDPCIEGTRTHLEKNFLRLRSVTGEEVVSCIGQAYSTFKDAQQKVLAAAAGKGEA
jgi:hypothetical protein